MNVMLVTQLLETFTVQVKAIRDQFWLSLTNVHIEFVRCSKIARITLRRVFFGMSIKLTLLDFVKNTTGIGNSGRVDKDIELYIVLSHTTLRFNRSTP